MDIYTIAIQVCLLFSSTWWRHLMETSSALLTICAGNSPLPGEFPTRRPVTGSFDVFFDLRLNKRLSKQWWGWWFQTLSRPLWRHRNVLMWLPDDVFTDVYWHYEYSIIKNNAEGTRYCFLVFFSIVHLLLNSKDGQVDSHHWPANTLWRNSISPSAHTVMIILVC